jgi:hypothetical protein
MCESAPSIKTRAGSSRLVQSDRVFLHKASGKEVNRPQLELMLSFVREGDTMGAIRWTGSAATRTICGRWFSD